MTKAERNDAIVTLYRGGYTQEAIGEMFGVDRGQISKIVGAKERTERIVRNAQCQADSRPRTGTPQSTQTPPRQNRGSGVDEG